MLGSLSVALRITFLLLFFPSGRQSSSSYVVIIHHQSSRHLTRHRYLPPPRG